MIISKWIQMEKQDAHKKGWNCNNLHRQNLVISSWHNLFQKNHVKRLMIISKWIQMEKQDAHKKGWNCNNLHRQNLVISSWHNLFQKKKLGRVGKDRPTGIKLRRSLGFPTEKIPEPQPRPDTENRNPWKLPGPYTVLRPTWAGRL